MKKLGGIALASILASAPCVADTVLGVYVGAQAWNMETEGSFADESSFASDLQNTNFSFDDETNGSAYIAVEHLIPLIPNVKLARTQLSTEGSTLLETSFTFGDELYTGQSTVFTQADITSTDITLYYEIFDNDLFSFDIGVSGKVLDGELVVRDTASDTQSIESLSGVVPMAYSKVQFAFPFTGWGAYAEGSFLGIGDHSLSDYQLAITYTFIDSLALDMTLQAGYRDVSADIDGLDDLSADLSFNGGFIGLEMHF